MQHSVDVVEQVVLGEGFTRVRRSENRERSISDGIPPRQLGTARPVQEVALVAILHFLRRKVVEVSGKALAAVDEMKVWQEGGHQHRERPIFTLIRKADYPIGRRRIREDARDKTDCLVK